MKNVLPTPSAPRALGPYSVATEAAGLVFVSGQVALDPGTGARVEGDVRVQADQVMRNIGAILGDVGLGYADIAKTTIFLDSIDDFAAVNEVYASYVGESPPARSTVEVAAMPGGFLVEIEVVAAR